MSHFTRIKTELKEIDTLVQSLNDMGFKTIEVHTTAHTLYGYQGDPRPDTAEVIIRRQHIGSASNDIGFKRQDDGAFTAIISEYDRSKYSQTWLNQLTQRYGYHLLKAKAPLEGFTIEEEQTLEDGTLRVVLARWV